MTDQSALHPLIRSASNIMRAMAGSTPVRPGATAPESIPRTAPSAAVSSATASTETANTSFRRSQDRHHRPVQTFHPYESPRANTRKEPERQEDSSRGESNMEGSLLDRRDNHIEVDDDYVEVSPHNINKEERRDRSTTGGKSKSSRDKV